jgi:hypothetical protein
MKLAGTSIAMLEIETLRPPWPTGALPDFHRLASYFHKRNSNRSCAKKIIEKKLRSIGRRTRV